MTINPGFIAFKLAYQISPIILTGGIASALGGALPIVALTQTGANSLGSILAARGPDVTLDRFFANYSPLPGSSLINQQIAHYPFANQSIAANAVISQPLNISLLMTCPAQPAPAIPGNTNFSIGGVGLQPTSVPFLGGYSSKLAVMTALQNTLAQHNNSGGTYSIVTPSYIYTYCIMTGMRDVSGGGSQQVQYQWQLDFEQPLVSTAAAQTALSGLMQKMTNGSTIAGTPTWTPAGLSVGNPLSLITQSLVPQPSLQ